ncbi:MAG: hypothetical protein ABIX01_14470 [Chitinophagaceae bacterium]
MSNVKLSAAELALAGNAAILLTKNHIISQVYELFGGLATAYLEEAGKRHLPAVITAASPKISRGENYLGLPWVMLDYPRSFAGDDIFSIRTMFWWGHHFGLFIFLKGSWLTKETIDAIAELPVGEEWWLCSNTDPWQHHFEPGNMIETVRLTADQVKAQVAYCGFAKLAKKIPIERWESVATFMTGNFEKMLSTAAGQ